MSIAFDLEPQVRTADPDRWLSSRFVSDPQARRDLIALYAFEAEVGAIRHRVSQPLLAEMRLAWWAEQMDGVFDGQPRKGHPVLEALSQVAGRRPLSRSVLDGVIEARIAQAHGEPADLEALYVAPMAQAARLLAPEIRAEAVAPAARLWATMREGEPGTAALKTAANRALRHLPAPAFPAVAHAALTDPAMAEPVKRLRLIWATLRGRV